MVLSELVSIGLIIDAWGALWVVAPDLPKKWRMLVIKATPKISQVQNSFDRICNNESCNNDVWKIANASWSSIAKKHHLNQNFRDVEEVWIDRTPAGDNDETIHLRIKLAGRKSTTGDTFTYIRQAKNEYINKKLRFWGWMALLIGFMMQFIGRIG